MFRGEAENEAELRKYFLKKFSDNYQIISTFPGTVEVMHKGIDKGSGLKKYVSWEKIDLADVIAFGDNENDRAMLEFVGHPYLMEVCNPTMENIVAERCKKVEDTLKQFL